MKSELNFPVGSKEPLDFGRPLLIKDDHAKKHTTKLSVAQRREAAAVKIQRFVRRKSSSSSGTAQHVFQEDIEDNDTGQNDYGGGMRWEVPLHLFDGIFGAQAEHNKLPPHLREDEKACKLLKKLGALLDEGITKEQLSANPHLVLLEDDFYRKVLLGKPVPKGADGVPEDCIGLVDWMLTFLEARISSIDSLTQRACLLIPTGLRQLKLAQPREWKLINLTHDWLHTFVPYCLLKVNCLSCHLINALAART
jgi:hypothetical protein